MIMDNFAIMQGIVMFAIVRLTLHFLYQYFCMWWRVHLLEKQLLVYQKLMETAFIEIHNSPLQLLAFLMREVEINEISKQDLLKHLHDVYQDVMMGVQNLKQED
jgi:hypothetical protein